MGLALISFSLLVLIVQGAMSGHPTNAKPTTTEPAIHVTDLAGYPVILAKPAERVVLVRGRGVQELALLLGEELDEKLVGWGPDIRTANKDAYDVFVARFPRLTEVPELGSIYEDSINPEQIIALNPDLVIMDTFMIRRGYKSVGRLQRAGLPLLFLESGQNPLQDAQKSLTLLGRVLGKEDVAKEINAYLEQQSKKVLGRMPKSEKKPTVYMEMGNRSVAEFGHTFGYDSQGARSTGLQC